MTYDKALASGEHKNLTNALYEQAKHSYSKYPKLWKKYKKLKKEDLVKQALSDKTLSPFDVIHLAKEHVGKGSDWGISNNVWNVLQKTLISKGLNAFVEEGAKNNILSSVLALQQAQNYLSKHNAESVVATIGGYDEKRGTVQVVLSIKGGDEKSPKEVLSFSTDSVLGKNKYYETDLDTVFNSSQNKEATR